MDGRMTIGAFSRACGLSAKVLRSYGDAGVLAPRAVDPLSGYRYYDPEQLRDAATVVLLRRAGVSVSDIARFLDEPSLGALDGWERSLAAEMQARRQALVELRRRLGLAVEIRPIEDRAELAQVFDVLGATMAEPIATTDFRFRDLQDRFAVDGPLMLVALADGHHVGGALAFRNDDGWATLRMIGVVEGFRRRGVGRRLVERLETEARKLGVVSIGLGTDDDPVGFYVRLGYRPNLLFQWVYDPDSFKEESEALLRGPLAGLRHWRSSFNNVPQLFVELDEPRLDLRDTARDMARGGHVGFMMSKTLRAA